MTEQGSFTSWLPEWVEPGWLTVATAIGLAVAFYAFFSTGPAAALRLAAGGAPPEAKFRRYSKEDLLRYLCRTPKGEASAYVSAESVPVLYARALRLDIGFALLYGASLLLLLDGTLGLSLSDPGRYEWMVAIPIAAAIVDIFEDSVLLTMIRRFGAGNTPGGAGAWWASTFTQLKWVLVLPALALPVVGAIALGINGANGWTPPPADLLWTSLGLLLYQPLLLAWQPKKGWAHGPIGRRAVTTFLNLAVAAAVLWVLPCTSVGFGTKCFDQALGLWTLEGFAWGLLLGGLVAAVIALAWGAKPGALQDARFTDLGTRQVLIMVVLIIVGTALAEEIIFRGVLFVAWRESVSVPATIAMTSITFGLWHIAPELERIKTNRPTQARFRAVGSRESGVLGTVIFTAISGVLFGALRRAGDGVLATGGILTGLMIHGATNVAGLLAAWRAPKPATTQEPQAPEQ